MAHTCAHVHMYTHVHITPTLRLTLATSELQRCASDLSIFAFICA